MGTTSLLLPSSSTRSGVRTYHRFIILTGLQATTIKKWLEMSPLFSPPPRPLFYTWYIYVGLASVGDDAVKHASYCVS